MANNRQKTDWTLKEISEWTHKDSIVSIPAIQRGLVWKPQQVELLWDSILRDCREMLKIVFDFPNELIDKVIEIS